MTQPILLTGAAGVLGTWLRPHLIARFGRLRSTDIAPIGPALANEEIVPCDLADRKAVDALVAGARAIVHLGGISREDTFDRILHANFHGTYNVYDSARCQRVDRIVFASSNHAIGFHPVGTVLDADAPQRPDSLYGVSKAFGEDLARYYVDKFGMDIACLRIGSALPEPNNIRALSTWLSYPDLFRLIAACIEAPHFGYAVLYGASDNDNLWWDNTKMSHIGYLPEDNAAAWRRRILPGADPRDPDDPATKFQGGMYCAPGYMNRRYVIVDPRDFAKPLAALRAKLDAARVVLRLDAIERGWSVDAPLAEDCAAGARSMRGVTFPGLRGTPAIARLAAERAPIAQNDGTAIDPAALRETYGVRARLLAPVLRRDALIGWIEAHAAAPRKWSDADVKAIGAAAKGVSEAMKNAV
ncbi:MAG: NAD-dependent epimerase/dehydratase family protein [Alphaproteobacteria bacterium]|nr:NAD-dependent epimerase/dehydratase family protein [Alphaproteobacteria bacterium]